MSMVVYSFNNEYKVHVNSKLFQKKLVWHNGIYEYTSSSPINVLVTPLHVRKFMFTGNHLQEAIVYLLYGEDIVSDKYLVSSVS